MNEVIETKRFFRKNYIQLQTNRIIIKNTSPFETSEFELSYEQIENKKIIETKVNFGFLVISSITAIVGFLYLLSGSDLWPIFFIASLAILFISFITKLKIIVIKSFSGQNIELHFTNKNKETVVLFSDQLINSANNYLLNKYSRIDRDLPIEGQLQNLIFLRSCLKTIQHNSYSG